VTERTTFILQGSKIYFSISALVHFCTLISVWFFSFNVYVSLILSGILIAHFQYLNSDIFLGKNKTIHTFILEGKALITTDKTGAQQQYPCVYCAYQSRFLVIINLGKQPLVIFKDSLVNHSLSQLNRLLNA
jgi:hypothetical protein